MAMNRRSFLGRTVQAVSGVLVADLLLTACGSGSGYGSGGGAPAAQGGNCLVNGVSAEVSVSHTPNHVVNIPLADVQAGSAKTYLLSDNGSGHVHQVSLSAQDFASLQNNQGVQVFSTGSGHTHLVTINCV